MNYLRVCSVLVALGTPALAQHAQVSAVAVDPTNPTEVWACNKDNNSVAVIDAQAGVLLAEIDVGQKPRSVAFTPDGARAFVADFRGNVPFNKTFVTPFDGTEIRGTVSVIDVASRTLTHTLTMVGIEPYGVAVAPNGQYFVVSGFRSGTMKFFDTQSLQLVFDYQLPNELEFITPPQTIADVDANRDGLPDIGDPRGFVIRADSQRVYITHNKSPYISVHDIQLDQNGMPTGVSELARIDTNTYSEHPIFEPTPIQVLKSQGVPRFIEDIALSPDGSRALLPHVLHNVNHDVNFDFGPDFAGDFANRVYPALTRIDTDSNTYDPGNDGSLRLHHELDDPATAAEYAPFGEAARTSVGALTIGGNGSPVLGRTLELVIEGIPAGMDAEVWVGTRELDIPMGTKGTLYVRPRFMYAVVNGKVNVPIPNNPALDGDIVVAQAAVLNNGVREHLSNGLRVRLSSEELGVNTMGERAGQPGRVVYNAAGDRAIMLNRGSEDIFLFSVENDDMKLLTVFPPRVGFVERAALDTTTPMGDLPLGMAVVDDPTTANDDALIYVINEVTRTLSVLRVDYTNSVIIKDQDQIYTLAGPDEFSESVRIGQELFEDASRAQTTGNFNNSCASCHFEGGEDANVWQRPDGPRTTMPVYGGTQATGLLLWRGVRLNMGETGPMFGGENGGHGIFTDEEQQGLVDYHEVIPIPLNPNIDPTTGGLTPLAALGQDLFFGTDDTLMNPNGRHAGCAECHPREDEDTGEKRGFTADFLPEELSSGENLKRFDPFCFKLQPNIVALNVRNVNSGANVDFNLDGIPDPDRNFDGYRDYETYSVQNWDGASDFQRDDPNSYLCPQDPNNPNSPLRTFKRDMRAFSIPTKLGVFGTPPYMHDHSLFSLRMVLDPEAQRFSPTYGDPAYGPAHQGPGVNKFFNEFHDIRGHEEFVPGASKVQLDLQSTDPDADIDALLAFIRSL